MTNATNNVFAAPAKSLAASTVAFIDASKGADNASTPFARSTLAAIMGGLSSIDMVESLVIAAFGSPKRDNGKPVGKVSQLRDFDGGARLYQAWKDVDFILNNLDADAPAEHEANDTNEAAIIGTGAIRDAVVGFILQTDGAPKALFGKTGVTATVKALMAEHNETVAAHNGVVKEPEGGEAEGGNVDPAKDTVALADRINALAVALNAASDEDFAAVRDIAATLSAMIDDRVNAMTIEPVQTLAA